MATTRYLAAFGMIVASKICSALLSEVSPTENAGVYLSDGTDVVEIAQKGHPNILRADSNSVSTLAQSGDPTPSFDGRFSSRSMLNPIANSRGMVAFYDQVAVQVARWQWVLW